MASIRYESSVKYKLVMAIMVLSVAVVGPAIAQSAGSDTYKAKCQVCHGADGLGNTPPGKALKARPLNSPEVLKESDAEMIAVIKIGKGKMPAFAAKLTDAQIPDLVAYIHTLQKK